MTSPPLFNPGYERFDLPPRGSAPTQAHVFAPEHVWAVRAALSTGRPLLLRGEPGTGKSQLARAAAYKLGRPYLTAIITSQSTSEDLLWEFDAVARLGNAQILGAMRDDASTDWKRELAPSRFLKPGPLWWTFDWKSAKDQLKNYHDPSTAPPFFDPAHENPDKGAVLLIDEIDKADADLPNGLLDALGNGGFAPPHGVPAVRQQSGADPLVVITTNEERELPAAFIRRCLVLNLGLPMEEDKLTEFLMGRGLVHFPETGDATGTDRAEVARLLIAERQEATRAGLPRPGQAEYLDLLRAVLNLRAQYPDESVLVLAQVQGLALRKQPS